MSNKSLARKNRHRFRTIRSTIKTFVLNLSLSHPNGNSSVYVEIPHPQCVGYGVSDEGVVTDIRKEFVFHPREDMDQAWQTGIMTLGRVDQ